jgi:FKBP-type peptidyl-prolyl cis-trans isomerase FkpA
MNNRGKILSILLFSFSIMITTSCLTEEEKVERTIEIEMQELDEFLTELITKGYDIDTTELGVYYIVNEAGSGNYPKAGDTLSVEYIGAFLDGNIFDASANYWPDALWNFVYEEEEIIQGLENALSVMKKGGEIDAIIPSNLAYGISGTGVIPPYTSILFNLKLQDLRPAAEAP